jgi:glutamate formiminotransferase / 5-formyltetrahydrofolate cyclo-ligase
VAQFSLVLMKPPILLAVPNVSEGRDGAVIRAIADAFTGGPLAGPDGVKITGAREIDTWDRGVRVLDVHSDADHHRSVFTLAGRPRELADALLRGAAVAVERIDVMNARVGDLEGSSRRAERPGQHPYVGALDVAPVVYDD